MRFSRFTVLLLLAFWLGYPMPVRAGVPLTLGVAEQAPGPFDEPAGAQLFAEQLARRLGSPVRLRMLASQEDLRRWMSSFREVDCGWFSEDFLKNVPAGELLPVASTETLQDAVVARRLVMRQGLDDSARKQLHEALMSMGSNDSEMQLLTSLGITRFVPAGELARGRNQATPAMSDPVKANVAYTQVPAPATDSGLLEAQPIVSPDPPPSAFSASPVSVGMGAKPVSASIPGVEPAPVAEPVQSTIVSPGTLSAAAAAEGGQAPPPVPPSVKMEGKDQAPVNLLADRLDYDWGQNLYRAGGNVVISQDRVKLQAGQVDYDQNGDLYRASGAVVVEQDGARLAADNLLWQAATQDAVATGAVTMSDPEGTLQGSSARANFGNQRGRVTDGRIFFKGNNFHLVGKEIERLDQSSYEVKEGTFTTCDGENPAWKFTAEQVNVDLGRYAVARDVWFELADLPVFYLPYMVFPVLTERESGFLMPRFGYSDRKGTFLSLAWYQVIDRNLDATVYLDYLSEIGVGKGLEFRYALGSDSVGEAKWYHISGFDNAIENDSAGQTTYTDMPDSYSLFWQHGGMLPGKVWLSADVEYVDNIKYFEEFGDTADQYTRDLTVSTILLQRNWDKLNLTAFGRYINDLDEDLKVDTTLQRLPEFGLTVPFYRLDENPLYSRTQLNATYFWREDETPATAQMPAQESGQRFMLRQGLSYVFKIGELFELTPEIAAYGRYYTGVDGEESDLLPEYATTLSTRLQRVYEVSGWGSLDRIQHSIEPQVTYRYVGNYDQENLPYYDPYDRINDDNLIIYALVNRLTGRTVDADGNRSYREFLNLRLSQSYDVEEPCHVYNADGVRDSFNDTEPFSSVRAELKVNPTPATSLSIDSWIPVYGDQRFSKVTASAGYTPSAGNSVSVNYSYDKTAQEAVWEKYPGVETTEPSEYIGLNLTTDLLAPVYASVKQRYDLTEDQSLETLVNLEYRKQCWSLFLTLRSRPSVDDRPTENEVMVGFALSGLGRIGGFGSSLP